MTEYKETLNLPKTDFPMKASLATREPKFLEKWQSDNLYQAIRKSRQGKDTFILHDGPPYANGSLHCGHALNKILKDIIVKSKTLSGYDAPYVPGWDCHGLPIELNVEKKHGKAGQKLSHKEFRQKCRDYAASQIELQREQFKRLGVVADWDNPYATMQYDYEANIIRALGEMIANGHLEQGVKPVYWCLDCTSSLAEAEVEYADKTSPSIDVAFKVADREKLTQAFSVGSDNNQSYSFVIWTTTPWTLPANQAVALHEDLDYALVDYNECGDCLIVANDLVDDVMSRYQIEDFTILATVKGKALEGIALSHPLFDRKVPVVLAEHVTLEAGTGCVHTAPAHGPDDYKVGLNYQLPMDNPVLGNGLFSETTPIFAGVHVKKADKLIIEKLTDNQVLVAQATLSHSYPHCWRHKSPVIFRTTPQWFISMDKNHLRRQALAGIEQTSFTPDWGRERIFGMVEGRPDWCISRQRYWGTPIPLFVHKESGELHPDTHELIEKVASLVEEQGIDAWFDLDSETLLGTDGDNYEKITDTLDVWFDAGVSHYAVLKQRQGLKWPADLYLEGSDQHRGWFNSSLITSTALYEKPPYKHVLTHGFTVDEKGIKLSKSKGNYIAPEKIINQSGADILRLWAASADYKGEVHLSSEIIKRLSDSYRRIRNTCRFLLANLFDFNADEHLLDKDNLVLLDKWAITIASQYQDDIKKAYDEYDFHVAVQKIQHFCTVEMGSFYLDVIKDRQYTTPTNSVARRSCQTAIYHILEMLSRWMAPILSFTSEEVWSHMCGEREASVFLSCWYESQPVIDDVDLNQWQLIQSVRNEVNRAIEDKRKAGIIGSALEANVTLFASGVVYTALLPIASELKFIFITSGAMLLEANEKTSSAEQTEMTDLMIEVGASSANKCERCWHRVDTVGLNGEHPGLCNRCVSNISGQDETRCYA